MIEEDVALDGLARVQIQPAPAADELAAIVAVLRGRATRPEPAAAQRPSPWRLAARREALRQAWPVPQPNGWALAARLRHVSS